MQFAQVLSRREAPAAPKPKASAATSLIERLRNRGGG